jgi:outer membrane protein assembly factor BamD (BamD/ComL family)
MERFGVNWTPTVLVMDSDGVERHRIEGFLPAPDFAAQLLLGLGHAAFANKDWKEAERRFGEVLDKYPESEAAAEALYWKGVSRYKATGEAAPLGETARAFQSRYTESSWAKKASVWAQSH